MNIGIDIDDTLSDITELKHKMISHYIKIRNLPYKKIRNDTNYIKDTYNWLDPDEAARCWMLTGEKIYKTATPRKNVAKVIKKLKKLGHKIFIITAREYKFHYDPYQTSKDWLIRHKIPFDELYVDQANKRDIILEKKLDFFIDDQISNFVSLKNDKVKCIIMDCVHNQNFTQANVVRVKTWDEVLKIITKN